MLCKYVSLHVNAFSLFVTEMKLQLNVMIIAIDTGGSVCSNYDHLDL